VGYARQPRKIGGDWYRDNIATCNTTVMNSGEVAIQEPGNMMVRLLTA
jgi:hypothetical protein